MHLLCRCFDKLTVCMLELLQMSARIQNDQEQLYLSLDKYRTAVSQLAGVTTSRVAVLSFLTDAPATSLVGHHRRLTSTGSSSGSASDYFYYYYHSDEASEWAAPVDDAGDQLQVLQLHSSSSRSLQRRCWQRPCICASAGCWAAHPATDEAASKQPHRRQEPVAKHAAVVKHRIL